ncbi:hypothetical protein MXB_2834 [Myxobolus squamalis]|nr:hypothetical protein MXB_2834 [Myxobolus squamalis]
MADAPNIFNGHKFRRNSEHKASVYYTCAKTKSIGCKASLVVQECNIYQRNSKHVCDEVHYRQTQGAVSRAANLSATEGGDR